MLSTEKDPRCRWAAWHPMLYRVAMYALDATFMVAMLVIPAAWVMDPLELKIGAIRLLKTDCDLRALLAPAVILLLRRWVKWLGARAGFAPAGPWEMAGFKKLSLSLAVTYIFFGAFELTLALAGFEAVLPPIVFVGKKDVGGLNKHDTLPDPVLMYRFKPNGTFAGRRINSIGFRNEEVDARKKPGTIRVICMGDSVTAQGRPSYAEYLDDRLSTNPPTPAHWEAFNVGVHGYSSLQGLKMFRQQVKPLDPDIVTVYFGWNDHWLNSMTDYQRMALEMGPFWGRILDGLRDKRLVQFMAWAARPVRHRAPTSQGQVFRVPPEEYRATLKALVAQIRSAGAVPLLLTAPRRSLTDEVVRKDYVRSIEEGNRTHDRYVEITREVARETGADILDLAALLTGPEYDSCFAIDGIHFDRYSDEEEMTADADAQPGLFRIAEAIDGKIREMVRRQSDARFRQTPIGSGRADASAAN